MSKHFSFSKQDTRNSTEINLFAEPNDGAIENDRKILNDQDESENETKPFPFIRQGDKFLNLDNTEEWVYPKHATQEILDKVKAEYKLNDKAVGHEMFFHRGKLIVRGSVLLLFASLYAHYIICQFKFIFDKKSKFLKKFTNNQTSNFYIIEIPTCNALYYQFSSNPLPNFILCYLSIYFYLLFEFLCLLNHGSNHILKKAKNKIFFWLGYLLAIFVYIISAVLFQILFTFFLFIFSLLFELMNIYISRSHSFRWPSFFPDSFESIENSSLLRIFLSTNLFYELVIRKESYLNIFLFVHLNTIIVTYIFHKRLKLRGIFGVIAIKHSSSLKNITNLASFGTILNRILLTLYDNINKSDLPVYFNSSKQETILRDLDGDIKQLFVNELNMYIYENSIFSKLFPWIFFFYLVLFLIIIFHWIYRKFKCYEADLEMAKIEQHLKLYYLKLPVWLRAFKYIKSKCCNANKKIEKKKKRSCINWFPWRIFYNYLKSKSCNANKEIEKKMKRSCINWFTWRIFYEMYVYFFGDSEVEIALKKIQGKYEFDQLKNT